jgi:hypothetical protein
VPKIYTESPRVIPSAAWYYSSETNNATKIPKSVPGTGTNKPRAEANPLILLGKLAYAYHYKQFPDHRSQAVELGLQTNGGDDEMRG